MYVRKDIGNYVKNGLERMESLRSQWDILEKMWNPKSEVRPEYLELEIRHTSHIHPDTPDLILSGPASWSFVN